MYDSLIDVRTDVIMTVRLHDFEERVKGWRDRGYNTAFFSCISREDGYNRGHWDGKLHLEDVQLTMYGDTVNDAIVPTKEFIELTKIHYIKRVIDAGVNAIYLEEPEFFGRSGYSEAFKREWKEYYGFDWRPQHESAENTFYSNRLKEYLYQRTYHELFCYAKEYGKTLGKDIKCYAAIHSLINYTQWHIISPEASLMKMPCVDGVIAQVWTGTSREPNYYQGVDKERTFETAFLEYGCMEALVRPYNKRAYFLTDPVEDNIKSWADYKYNYQGTYVAELLYPRNNYYEVMPWPSRIYKFPYGFDENGERTTIPRSYSTQMQVMVDALNNMPVSDNKVSGSNGISIMLSSTMVFQPVLKPISNEQFIDMMMKDKTLFNKVSKRHWVKEKRIGAGKFIAFDRLPEPMTKDNDPKTSNYFGLAMPLVKRGIPVGAIHLESVDQPDAWENTKVLLMTYSNMKPQDADCHQYIANWVKQGGKLIYFGRDDDSFQKISDWWNQNGNSYYAPSAHLFKLMDMDEKAAEGTYTYGKGTITVIRKDPKELALAKDGDTELLNIVKPVYESTGEKLEYKNSFYLERGPYDIIAVLSESVNDEPLVKKGLFIDLFDPTLPVIKEKVVKPGEQAFLYNLSRIENPKQPKILAMAGRAYDETVKGKSFSFVAKAPTQTTNAMRIYLPKGPKKIIASKDGQDIRIDADWNEESKTLYLEFENSHNGVNVSIDY